MRIIATVVGACLGILISWTVVQAGSTENELTPTPIPTETTITPTETPTQTPEASPTPSSTTNNGIDSQAANFRLDLHTLLREHAVLSTTTLAALYRNEDTTRLHELMNDNREQLAQKVEDVYGETTRDRFVDLWVMHVEQYENYVVAKRNNSEDGMNAARDNLQVISDNLGDLFDNSGENITSSAVSASMMEHVNRTLNVVDPVADNDTTQVVNAVKGAYDQAGELADILSRGMVADNPVIFN